MFLTKPSLSSVPLPLLRLLQLSINNKSLKLTQKCHAMVCQLGLHQHLVVLTKLIAAYSVSKNPVQARILFDSIHVKDVSIWNTLIRGFAKNNLYRESFEIFNELCWTENLFPDGFTFSALAKVSADNGDLLAGESIHGKCIKLGYFADDVILSNCLMSLYGKCDRMLESRRVFDEMPQRTVSSWNIMLAGHVNCGNYFPRYEIWEFLKCMLKEGLKPNEFTVSNLLPMCECESGESGYGRDLHCYIIRNELDLISVDSNVHLGCCLIDMYSRCGKLNMARTVFDQMTIKNIFAWTAMMSAYAQAGDTDEAIVLFHEIQRRRVEPNEVSLLTILPACSSVAGLMGIQQIHTFAFKKGFSSHTKFCNSLIDVYSKSGFLTYARSVFEHDCVSKDVISWSSMITGYGLHGEGQNAVALYDEMLDFGIKPDAITIVGVLSACSKSGLVGKGLDVYNKATNIYGFEPTSEMCSCLVDMLGRSGQLNEALSFIKTMPLEPGPTVWGALVNASEVHSNHEMRILAYKSLIQIEPENPSNYVSLSNLYATSRKWDAVAEVRGMMKERSLKKLPGCSWITINSQTHSFLVADKAHPTSDRIYNMLNKLLPVMKGSSHRPDPENLR